MRTRSVTTLVRKYYKAYQSRDRKTLEVLLSDDFTFSSPLGYQLGKEDFFAQCWPKADEYRAFQIEKIFEMSNEAFVRYSCEPQRGSSFRNTEYFRTRRGKIREVDVYFGRNLAA